jgi:hypothetical protein
MMSLRSWWKRLCQPGEPQPEYVFGAPCSGDFDVVTISAHNVTEVSYYAIHDGKRLPIMTMDGCPLTQHIEPGRIHVAPADIWPFVEIVPVGRVVDPSLTACIEFGGEIAVDEVWPETSVDDE